MLEVKAPKPYKRDGYVIFLAGAIDMGQAENWQEKVAKELQGFDVTLLNPRRDDWDSSWVQSKEDPQFSEQVNWEQDGLDTCDLVLVVFTKDSKAPITFLELGAHLDDKVVVCCPEGFYRKGNVDIVCERHKVPVYQELDELLDDLKAVFTQHGLAQ